MPLDFRVEVGVGQSDCSDRRQGIEQCQVGVIEGLGPAAAGDGQPEPAVGQLDRRGQRAVLGFGSFRVERDLGRAQQRAGRTEHGGTRLVAADGAVDVERGLEQAAQPHPVVPGVEVPLAQVPQDEEWQHREREELGL